MREQVIHRCLSFQEWCKLDIPFVALFLYMRVVLAAVMTLDGKIARHLHEPSDWASEDDQREFRAEFAKHPVVLYGRNTYEAYKDRRTEGKLHVILTRKPDEFESLPGDLEFTSDSPERIVQGLKQRGYESVLVAGGSAVYALFLNAGLVDDLYITIEGRMFGGGVSFVESLDHEIEVRLVSSRQIGPNTVLLHYKSHSGAKR